MYGKAPQSRKGSALVVILFGIVLLSSTILVYFSSAQLQRQISFSSAGIARADALAQAAEEVVTGDLLNEIRAGSTLKTTGSVSIYMPVSNQAAVPSITSTSGISNLVKISAANVPAWKLTSGTGPVRSLANNASTTAARDGRSISLKRWLKPNFVLLSQTNSMPSPDWVIVTRGGPVDASAAPALADLGNPNISNTKYAIGRFAYAIYNEVGLLDITSAGYPSTETGAAPGRKGLLAFADLTRIPNGSGNLTQQQVDDLVFWRNATYAASGSNAGLLAYLQTYAAPYGFLRVRPGDQTFVSRQDLIRYAQKRGITNALPYLSTFSREKNAPNWMPPQNASDLGGNNGTGSVYAYKDRADLAAAANRNLANVRGNDNAPLIVKRFSLSRLALLETGTSTDIAAYFGLSGAPGQWTYSHGNAAKILTLDEVRQANRQPDFFELLKAAILEGSLGRDPGSGVCSQPQNMAVTDNQIIQIGANIIDQYDADSQPTTITFNSRDFYGIENLPYLTRAAYICYIDPSDVNQPANYPASRVMGVWLQPELWRPCQDSGTSSLPAYTRIQVTGTLTVSRSTTGYPSFLNWLDGTTTAYTGADAAKSQITFDPSKIPFDHPASLCAAHGAFSSYTMNLRTGWSGQPAAFYIGNVPVISPLPTSTFLTATPKPNFSLDLQWSNDGTMWHTYSRIEKIVSAPTNTVTGAGSITPLTFFAKADPRTDRFGVSLGWVATGGGSGYAMNASMRPGSGSGYFLPNKLPNATGFSFTSTSQGYLGLFSDNRSGSAAFYADKDSVIRRAAGAYADASGSDGYPLIQSASASDNQNGRRPIVLNRPFQSVGELGYAFRDLPFKELDFFTKESADAGLLDVFTVNDEPAITGGRVSLNTPYPEVLEALLNGSIRREYVASEVLKQDTSALARAVSDYVSANGPLQDRGEIVTKLSDTLTSAFSSNADKCDKTQRESVVRALADVANLRTWNLMIDVIAQSGRYPAKPLSCNDFVVEGEKRYWVHIAIDRYTGEIVDRAVEAVNE